MNTEINSDSEAREALNELSGDSFSEIRSDNAELVDSIEDYLDSCGPLNPPSVDILADYYSLGSDIEDGIAGGYGSGLDSQENDTLYLNVTPDASAAGIIMSITNFGYQLKRINLRGVEPLWEEEDGTRYYRSDNNNHITLIFRASNPTTAIEDLIEHGCSPAEALDYWATEMKGKGGVSIQEWSDHRDVSEQAVSANRKEAIKKIPDEYSG